jgi:hypothetical protein
MLRKMAVSIPLLHFIVTKRDSGGMKSNYGRYKSTLQRNAGLAPDVIIDCRLTNVGRRLGRAPVDGETVQNHGNIEFLLQKTMHTGTGTARPGEEGTRGTGGGMKASWRQNIGRNA